MLGCLVVDHMKSSNHSINGKIVLTAITDVLLTKLTFEEWRLEDKSDELYLSRFEYFNKKFNENKTEINYSTWFQIAMIPIGLSADSLDAAQQEARRCLRVMNIKETKKREGEIIASLIFLGKEGLDKNIIEFFLKEEYNLVITQEKNAFGFAINSLLKCENFESYIATISSYKRHNYRMLCGGLGQVYFNRLPTVWVNETLDLLEDDIKSMTLSFMKAFNCLPSW